MLRTLKYLAPLVLNFTMLTGLLFLLMDRLERLLDPERWIFEILKLVGVSFLCLVAARLVLYFVRRRKPTTVRSETKLIAWTTVIVSSWMYFTYVRKIVHHTMHREVREQVAGKLILPEGFLRGSSARNLSREEYMQILESNTFPGVPKEAVNIGYSLIYEDFLPDYGFTLEYDLPAAMHVDTMTIRKGDYLQFRRVELRNGKKHVVYSENLF